MSQTVLKLNIWIAQFLELWGLFYALFCFLLLYLASVIWLEKIWRKFCWDFVVWGSRNFGNFEVSVFFWTFSEVWLQWFSILIMFSVCLVDERVGKEKEKKLCVFSLLLFVTWRAKRSTSWSFDSISWFSRVKLFYFPTKTTDNSRDLRLTFYNFLFLYSFFSEPNRAIGLAWVSGAFYFYF